MEQDKHGYIFRDKDINRVIADYGRKPPQGVKERTIDNLKLEREKFRRLEEFRARNLERSQNRSL